VHPSLVRDQGLQPLDVFFGKLYADLDWVHGRL
jgi:hypothetical protein